VDLSLGLVGPEKLRDAFNELLKPSFPETSSVSPLLKLTARHFAYIKVSEGCDKICAFCSIPSFRGKHRSRPTEILQDEFRQVVENGAKEISLIGQDILNYGRDQGEKIDGIITLLKALLKTEGDYRIRLMYLYPTHITDKLLDFIASENKICKYLDMPFQHASNKVLKLMRRATTREKLSTLYHNVLKRIPGVTLRTTMMTGYPGEGKADFRELLTFLDEHPFHRLGTFAFSKEQGTAAFELPGQIDRKIAEARKKELMLAQEKHMLRYHQSQEGTKKRLLIDAITQDGIGVGRSEGEAPEIDPIYQVRGQGLAVGEFVNAKVTTGNLDSLLAETIQA